MYEASVTKSPILSLVKSNGLTSNINTSAQILTIASFNLIIIKQLNTQESHNIS